jgi:Tol biopolymer transport system component
MGDGKVRRLLPQAEHLVVQAAVAPDGQLAVVRDNRLGGMVVDLADGSVKGHVDPGGAAAWSPDGQHIAFERNTGQSGHELVITDRLGNTQKTYDAVSYQIATDLAWSPDNRTIALSSSMESVDTQDRAGVHLVDTVSGQRRLLTPRRFLNIAWSHDGQWLLGEVTVGPRETYTPDPGPIVVVPLNGAPERVLKNEGAFPAWSASGDVVAAASTELEGLVRIPFGGGAAQPFSAGRLRSWPRSLAPDGQTALVAFDRAQDGPPGAYLVNGDGCPRKVLRTDNQEPWVWGGWLPAGKGFIIYPYPPNGS